MNASTIVESEARNFFMRKKTLEDILLDSGFKRVRPRVTDATGDGGNGTYFLKRLGQPHFGRIDFYAYRARGKWQLRSEGEKKNAGGAWRGWFTLAQGIDLNEKDALTSLRNWSAL